MTKLMTQLVLSHSDNLRKLTVYKTSKHKVCVTDMIPHPA